MPTRFMTDPHQMRAMAGRFDVHAQTVEDEARKMWASSLNIAGAGWTMFGMPDDPSLEDVAAYRHKAVQALRKALREAPGLENWQLSGTQADTREAKLGGLEQLLSEVADTIGDYNEARRRYWCQGHRTM
jgi:ESAT-6 family protein